MLVDQFDILITSIVTIVTAADKIIFENNILNTIASITQAAVVNVDYDNRKDVIDTIDRIVTKYDEMIEVLDELQTDTGTSPDSYIPDAGSLQAMDSLINATISQLFNIALNQKQERVIYLEDDTNLVTLTHKYYGLDADDENMSKMIKDNNIGLSEILQLKKNRKIVYYQ